MSGAEETLPRDVTRDPDAQPGPEAAEVEWVPVACWGARAEDLVGDIEGIQRFLSRLRGAQPGGERSPAELAAIDLLEGALRGRREELALEVLHIHSLLPPGEVSSSGKAEAEQSD